MRTRFEIFRDHAKEYRWRLKHWNGNVVATSGEGYVRKQGALNAVESIKQNAPQATVEDLT